MLWEAERGEEIQDGEPWCPGPQKEGDEDEEEKETGTETARSAAGASLSPIKCLQPVVRQKEDLTRLRSSKANLERHRV